MRRRKKLNTLDLQMLNDWMTRGWVYIFFAAGLCGLSVQTCAKSYQAQADTIHLTFLNDKKSGVIQKVEANNLDNVKYIVGYTKTESKKYVAFLFEGNRGNIELVKSVKNIPFIDKGELAKKYRDKGNAFLQNNVFYMYEQRFQGGWIRFKLKCRYLGANLKNDYQEGQE